MSGSFVTVGRAKPYFIVKSLDSREGSTFLKRMNTDFGWLERQNLQKVLLNDIQSFGVDT